MNIKYKMAIWIVVIAILTLGFWINIDQWLNHSGKLTYSNWNFLTLVFFILLTSAIGTGLVMFRSVYFALCISALVIIPQLLIFGFSLLNLLGLVLFMLFGYNTWLRINNELEQRIKFRVSTIIRNSLKPLILGMFLVVSFSAYQSSALESVKEMDRVPSINATFAKEIYNKVIGQNYNLNAQQTDQVIQQTISDTNNQLNNMLSPYLHFAPPILAFVLFLVLYGLNWIFILLSILVCVGIIAGLRILKFIRIEERDVKAEGLII